MSDFTQKGIISWKIIDLLLMILVMIENMIFIMVCFM